jgi:hypothetical protein
MAPEPVPEEVLVEGAMIMWHPTLYMADDIPLDEAMSIAHRALSQVHMSCTRKMRASLMSAGASSYGPPCSRRRQSPRGRRHGHGSVALTCKWRPLANVMSTPCGPLLTRRSCMHWPRPGLVPSSSKRGTSPCAHARSTSGRRMWKSWRGSYWSKRGGCWSRKRWRTPVPRSWPVSSIPIVGRPV